MLGPRLAHRDERRGLGQPVDLNELPAEVALDTLNRCSRRRRPGRHHPHTRGHVSTLIGRRVGERDQHGRRGAQHGDRLVADEPERLGWIHLSQTHMGTADRRDDPDERPPVGVEHRERPQVPVRAGHRVVQQRADRVHVGVPVRDHHTLRARRCAAGVVDRQQIALGDIGPVERRRFGIQQGLVRLPPRVLAFQRNAMLHGWTRLPDGTDRFEIVGVRTDHLRTAMLEDVLDLGRRQPEVDGDQHRPDLRRSIERFEVLVRVGRYVADTVALRHTQTLERRRPAVAALEELLVGISCRTVDHGFPLGIQAPRAAHELQWCKRCFHRRLPRLEMASDHTRQPTAR